ncbi:MAG: electron transfer flavoprotein beta subunit [Solirubrobacteraceae bacterium]|nr:electron transfer flavoprotein beta subunit [Solirubrobacteraceae bacterium]
MKLCVCIKEVPPSSVSPRLDPQSGRLERATGHLNGPDEYAIEEALKVRDEAGGGEVVVLSMAPARGEETLRRGLAMGADRAVLVSDPSLAGSDLLGTSRVLAAALEREQPDLVLFGWEGTDANGAMLWAAVAERLGLPVLSRVWQLTVADGSASARRQMEYGFDVAETPLPAVVAISGAINAPRYPSLKGVVASKKKPVATLSVDDLGIDAGLVGDAGARTRVLEVGRPAARTPGILIEDEAHAAERLLEYLGNKGVI